ncbi:MAG: hypothetical protein WD156_11340 [Acidimicrobiia bacterium]
MRLDEQLRTYVGSIADPVTAHEARQRTSPRPTPRRPRMALAVGFGVTVAAFGLVTALNIARQDAPVATDNTALTEVDPPANTDPVEFGNPVLIDTGTVFIPGDFEETAPSDNGSTLVGASGIRVAAVTETPQGRIAVGTEAVGLRSLAAVWIETNGAWSRVPPQEAFGGLDHELSDIIASGLSMTDIATTPDGTLIAVGIDTRINPAHAVAWTSENGEAWTLTGPLPDGAGDLASVDLTTLPGGSLIAHGVLPPTQGTMVWLSPDGLTWEPAHQPDAVIHAMTVDRDGTLIAVGHRQQSAYDPNLSSDDSTNVTAAAWRSTDRGRTWTESDVQPPTSDAVRATTITGVTALDTGRLLAVGTRHTPEGVGSTNGQISGDASLVVWEWSDDREWRPIHALDNRPLLGPTVTSVESTLIVTADAVSADHTTTVVYAMSHDEAALQMVAEFDGRIHKAILRPDGLDLFATNTARGVDLWHLPYR